MKSFFVFIALFIATPGFAFAYDYKGRMSQDQCFDIIEDFAKKGGYSIESFDGVYSLSRGAETGHGFWRDGICFIHIF